MIIFYPFWPPPCRKAPDSELAASAQVVIMQSSTIIKSSSFFDNVLISQR